MDDRAAIIAVLNRYADACDSRDWALFVGPDESVQVRLCEDVVKAGLPACTIKPGAKVPSKAG